MIKVTHAFADGSRADTVYGKKIDVTQNEKVYMVLANVLKGAVINEETENSTCSNKLVAD